MPPELIEYIPLPLIFWGTIALVIFISWLWSRRARLRAEAENAKLFAAHAAASAAASAAADARRRVHDHAVTEWLNRIAQGQRIADPSVASMLPLKKGEEIFYAMYSKAKTARGDIEPGVLIVTNQRVHWNYSNPDRGDVLKTWRGVATFHAEGAERLVIEWGSGKPLVLLFSVPDGGDAHDARIAAALMARARAVAN